MSSSIQFYCILQVFAFLTLNTVPSSSAYEVGVDYHAYSANFVATAFLQQYHDPTVRAIVLAELQGIADRGASFVTLDIWFGHDPNDTTPGQYWQSTFPISDQEKTNLHQYAEDVATIQSKVDDHRIRLNIALFWVGAAFYREGNLTSGLGPDRLNATEFTARAEKSIDGVLEAVSNIRRPDGVLIVNYIDLDYEVMVGYKPNQDWFLATHYPRFISTVTAAGFIPTMYFWVDAKEAVILNSSYVDPEYPALNGHQSMYWVYRSLNFLNSQKIPLPSRIDLSCYIERNTSTYASLVNHVLNDAEASLTVIGAPKLYGISETHYFPNDTQRREYGQAWALEAKANPHLERLRFWTTPDAGGRGVHIGYPFAIEDYLLPSSD